MPRTVGILVGFIVLVFTIVQLEVYGNVAPLVFLLGAGSMALAAAWYVLHLKKQFDQRIEQMEQELKKTIDELEAAEQQLQDASARVDKIRANATRKMRKLEQRNQSLQSEIRRLINQS